MNRRGFLQAILAAGVAPAFVRSPMGLFVPNQQVVLIDEFYRGDATGIRQSKRERRKVRCNCAARIWKHTRGRACRELAAQAVFVDTMTNDEWAELF